LVLASDEVEQRGAFVSNFPGVDVRVLVRVVQGDDRDSRHVVLLNALDDPVGGLLVVRQLVQE